MHSKQQGKTEMSRRAAIASGQLQPEILCLCALQRQGLGSIKYECAERIHLRVQIAQCRSYLQTLGPNVGICILGSLYYYYITPDSSGIPGLRVWLSRWGVSLQGSRVSGRWSSGQDEASG